MQQYNFGSGPGILPTTVLEQAAQGILNFENSGLSILEISHRSALFENVLQNSVQLVKSLLNVPDDYHIVFIPGGASAHFALVPLNFLGENEIAGYLETGVWASKALQEAKRIGNTSIVASSADKNFTYIPKNYLIQESLKYIHITTNNTIYGTQLKTIPNTTVPIVADMSSDIFSKPIDISKFAMIYAGAQKNMGPAGTTLCIIKDSFLNSQSRTPNAMHDYKIHVANGSMYNTPPVYAIYVCMLTLQWLTTQGGVAKIHEINKAKANQLYNTIDDSKFFEGTVAKEDRSMMNICFNAINSEIENKFLEWCKDHAIVGIKGHRLSGGFRASIYNACPASHVHYLCESIIQFENSLI
ncbi:MAG: 3-phosphoserine/phosphohydroxythreonine transaminase [Bacteroidota bacterium]|jgi:phosphoserine aminotransferase